MATQPVFGGVTLPHPIDFDITEVLAGATKEMADGSLTIDVVDPYSQGIKRKIFKLAWSLLTNTDANTVETQYWSMVSAGYAVLVAPDGSTSTVEPLKDVKLERQPVKMNGGTLRYNIMFEVKDGA